MWSGRRAGAGELPGEDEAQAMGVLLRKITGFSGLVHENMYRSDGWRFLTIGRSLERVASMAALLARFADPTAPDGALELAVEVGDSAMSHRRRYSISTTRETVIDLLAMDTVNPRSILYHLAELREQIGLLPGGGPTLGSFAAYLAEKHVSRSPARSGCSPPSRCACARAAIG